MHKHSLITLSFLIIGLLANTFAQNKNSDLITDRPDITESASTINPGWLQIETGFSLAMDKFNDGTTSLNSYTLAGTLLRFGITNAIELRAGGGYQIEKTETGNIEDEVSGLSDIVVGGKLRLTPDIYKPTQIAILFHLVIPVGEDQFRSETVEPQIILALSNDISENFSLSYNAGGTWNFNDEISNYVVSVAGGLGFTESIGGYAEVYGEFSNVSIPAYFFDGGITYLPAKNIQLDTSAGVEIVNSSSFWFINTGFTIRIPR